MTAARLLLILCCTCCLPAVDTSGAYRAWTQGRPAEALPALAAAASTSGHWAAWFDYGLAAAAAGENGTAVAALLNAHLLAPGEHGPVQGLAALGQEAPTSWTRSLGPIALLSSGWLGMLIAAGVGLGLGWAALGTRHRLSAGVVALVGLLLLAPGLTARIHDQGRRYIATVEATWLLDASGKPLREIPAGSILAVRNDQPWEGRWLVATAGGARGSVPIGDCADLIR